MHKIVSCRNALYRAINDCWAIIFVSILRISFIESNKLFTFPMNSWRETKEKIRSFIYQILNVIDTNEYTLKEVMFCYTTMYCIIMLCMFTMMLLTIIIYTLDHRMFTIIAFTGAILATFYEIQLHFTFYTQVVLMFFFLYYAFFRIYKSFERTNPGSKIVAETADSFLQFGFAFYLKLMLHLFCVFLKSFFIRLMNFNSKNPRQRFYMGLFLVYSCYSELFVAQAYTAQTLSRKVYCDSPSFIYEFFPMFFTTSAAALLKIVYIVTGSFFYIVNEILGSDFESSSIYFAALEDDRCYFFYIIFKRTSFFNGLLNWKKNFWRGDIKTNLRKLSFKQDLFPLIIIMFVGIKKLIKEYAVIRPVELFFIIPCNSLVIAEIFNTYAVMKILEYAKTSEFANLALPDIDYNQKSSTGEKHFIKHRKNKLKLHDFFSHKFFNKRLIQDSSEGIKGYYEQEKFMSESDPAEEYILKKD